MFDLPILPGLEPVADRYDGFILDLWGVLHDGHAPYPGAVETLDRLRAAGKRVCLLSNAPRRCASVAAKLAGMGITADHFDHLLTSGEATHLELAEPSDPWHAALGDRFLHIGPDKDVDVYATVDRLRRVEAPEEADFVLNSGILDHGHTVADYEAVLRRCAARRLPMVCANPDLVVMVGDAMELCAGSLAERYRELGGDVRYHGKPHAPVYRRCFELLGIAERARVLAVGDSFRTDVAGANAAGIDAAFVAGGIHLRELAPAWGEMPDATRLAELARSLGHRPTWAIPAFRW